jgi:hypothetical protein
MSVRADISCVLQCLPTVLALGDGVGQRVWRGGRHVVTAQTHFNKARLHLN